MYKAYHLRTDTKSNRKPDYGAIRILCFAALIILLMPDNSGKAEAVYHSDTTAAVAIKEPVVKSGFIFETAPFPSSHASTIVEVKGGLVAAWFGGKEEQSPDVGIWVSRFDGKRWSQVTEVVNGVQKDGSRFPCWNPVLFQPKQGALLLFYRVGPDPRTWWSMLTTSTDEGKSWSKPERLPDGYLGPIKNKPVQLADGSLLCGSSTEFNGWKVHMERTADFGKTWQKTTALNDARQFGAIQPTILVYPTGKIQILCRSRQGSITESWSADGGKTWSQMQATMLPNPNSGIDAVMLKDGRALLVYNHSKRSEVNGRSRLNIALSSDGKLWKAALMLENQPGEYSYPAVIQTSDGLVHITYTWKRQRIKHVIVDPDKFELRDMPDGNWRD